MSYDRSGLSIYLVYTWYMPYYITFVYVICQFGNMTFLGIYDKNMHVITQRLMLRRWILSLRGGHYANDEHNARSVDCKESTLFSYGQWRHKIYTSYITFSGYYTAHVVEGSKIASLLGHGYIQCWPVLNLGGPFESGIYILYTDLDLASLQIVAGLLHISFLIRVAAEEHVQICSTRKRIRKERKTQGGYRIKF